MSTMQNPDPSSVIDYQLTAVYESIRLQAYYLAILCLILAFDSIVF